MGNMTAEQGPCTPPFLQESQFSSNVGYLPGRFCAPVPTIEGTVQCCLPCPITDWVYSDDFDTIPKAASWLNVAGMACTLSLLISFFVLPKQTTNRHYLTVGLVAAVCLLQLGFIIPLGAQPDQCHDDITPNDMYSDLTCAFSGAFLLFGGFAAIIWGFLRSVSIHLQICWQVVPGEKFFWSSMVAGWGVPALIIAVALPLTGTSYRFGATCHINHEQALKDYWGPLLAFAAISTILQFSTFGFCIKVYLKSLLSDGSNNSTTQASSNGLPSYSSRAGSMKTVTAGQAYRRVKKVIALQWRGTVIVLIIIINVVFLAVVFVQMDNTVTAAMQDLGKAEPWLLCLVLNGGNKTACLDQVQTAHLVTKESTVMAVLILLSLNGIWTFLFLGRYSMVKGWIELLRRPFAARTDFVSVDARRFSAMSGGASSTNNYKHYEMINSPSSRPESMPASMMSMPIKSPDAAVLPSPAIDRDTATPVYRDGLSPLPQSPASPTSEYRDSDYFGKEANFSVSSGPVTKDAEYRSPKLSFSTPRPPSSGRAFSREGSLSRPYSRNSPQPQRAFTPQLGTMTKAFSPAIPEAARERGARSRSPPAEWDPASTHARGNTTPDSMRRQNGVGKILKKDEGF